MVIMFNIDSFTNERDIQNTENQVEKNLEKELSMFSKEELFKFRDLFWNIEPRGYENLLFRLSQFSSLSIDKFELVPPVILPDSSMHFEDFAIDLSTNKQLIVSANLYRGDWSCPLVCLTSCNDSSIFVINEKGLNRVNFYMNKYNIKASKLG